MFIGYYWNTEPSGQVCQTCQAPVMTTTRHLKLGFFKIPVGGATLKKSCKCPDTPPPQPPS